MEEFVAIVGVELVGVFGVAGRGGPSKESNIEELISPEDGAVFFCFGGGVASKESKIEDVMAPDACVVAAGVDVCFGGGEVSKASKMDEDI